MISARPFSFKDPIQAGDSEPEILIIGLGNPILGDDGVGWAVAKRIEARLQDRLHTCVEYSSAGGLSLMERLVGCSQAILIDSIVTGMHPPGSVMSFPLDEFPARAASYTASAHDTSLQDALQMARQVGAVLPTCIAIVAVEISPSFEFSEQLSEPVAAAIPAAEELVWNILSLEVANDFP